MALNKGSAEVHLGLRRAVRAALLALLAATLVWEGRAKACSVPVFRYALERFPSDPYEFVIFHRGPLSAEHKKVIAATEKLAEDTNWPVNLKVRLVDLAAKEPQKPDPAAKEAQKPAWTPPLDGPLPWLVVAPPGGSDGHVWSGQLRADDIQALVDSPARREVAHRLMQGDSAVFLFLESGQKEADAAAAQTLQATLAKMEKSLQLPPDDGTGRVNSELPLKISFSSSADWAQRSGGTRPGQDPVQFQRRNRASSRPNRVSGFRARPDPGRAVGRHAYARRIARGGRIPLRKLLL